MSTPLRHSPGFTLVEVLVAIVITGIVSISLAQMLQVGQRSSDRNRVLTEMQQNARVGIESLTDDLRHVSYGKDPTQPSIYYAGPDSVDFVADVVADHAGAERVNYFLSPAGDPDTPNPTDTILMKVVRDSANVLLYSAPQAYGIAPGGLAFRWFNGGGTELANPVPQPELVGEVLVTLTVAASRELSGAYPQMAVSSTIYPRNLPLSPARSRPSTPSCGGITLPNCEAATMSWTVPTTNTDGTELPSSEISHFALYFGTNPDTLDLYAKLARNITQWTVPGLADGAIYYLAVACVSLSGVESYRCVQAVDMTSPLTPMAPTNLQIVAGAGAALQWDAVTQFTTNSPITTPISYCVYRDPTPGFTAAAGNRMATVTATTAWTDTTSAGCGTYYYRVQAKACGNEGVGSNEVHKSLPAPPAAATGLAAHTNATPGTAVLRWSPFAQRDDGTILRPEDIQSYKIYADLVPAQETLVFEISAPADSAVLTGLSACQTWYLNVRCVDTCGHDGAYVASASTPVLVTSGCAPGPPAAPAYLTVTAQDNRVQLQWPENTTDCDLAGYRIYYGSTPGGPYNGVSAAEGASPVTVTADQVTLGGVCRKDLTGLGLCQDIYATVTAFDWCSPSNESTPSPEDHGTTTCVACDVSDVCTGWAADLAGTAVHLELWSNNPAGETIAKLIPTFTGGALVREVWFGRPLVKIWAGDGSAGQDGAVGNRPSDSVLNITDITLPTSTSQADGEPLRVLFTNSMAGVPLSLRFQGLTGFCTADNTPAAALDVEGFDGAYIGWTSLGTAGVWLITGGEMAQISTLNRDYIITKDGIAGLGALTMETKVKVTGGMYRSLYLAFRVQDAANYYQFGIRTDTNKVLLDRVKAGNQTTLTSASMTLHDNQWYNIRVEATGGPANVHINGWIDCNQVINYTDATSTWATGQVGLSTRRGMGRFDDVRVYAGSVLP